MNQVSAGPDQLDSMVLEDESTGAASVSEGAVPDRQAPTIPDQTDATAAAASGSPSSGSPSAAPTPGDPNTATVGVPWAPPSGNPFAFKLDGRDTKPDGVIVKDGHIIWPQPAWDAFNGQIGSREHWNQKQQGFQRQLAERDHVLQSKDKEIAKAREESQVAHQFVRGLIDASQRAMQTGNRDEFLGIIDQMMADMPLKEAHARLALQQQKLEQQQHQETQAVDQQQQAAIEQQVTGWADQLATWATELPEFQVLGTSPQDKAEIADLLTTRYLAKVFAIEGAEKAADARLNGFEPVQQFGNRVLYWHPARVREALAHEAGKVKRYREGLTKATDAASKNAAVLQKTPPPARPSAPPPAAVKRNENGQFVRTDRAAQIKKGRSALDDFTFEDATRND